MFLPLVLREEFGFVKLSYYPFVAVICVCDRTYEPVEQHLACQSLIYLGN
ncbi:hypothetical protein ACE1CA_22900 [Aerosakkonemataceae cyanobacterium BLCC-F167]|uniref:Uncharacterized protein n=1 Tax=Floridaenema evergladense BLCC-F167 TaxID=3153639 RepID=A0ABV4WQK9_9CYAN